MSGFLLQKVQICFRRFLNHRSDLHVDSKSDAEATTFMSEFRDQHQSETSSKLYQSPGKLI
ncbi:MAG: hypothetical protein BEN18_01190 [Epulopiscium sp. Nuni2H_MBin001]|nr:MAG: hypothetical protein BEN18_01190 [Epulopiscium sp. Nuni2H_MBin001]